MSGTQPTGGQPKPEAVEEAHAESMGLALTREQWILTRPWRLGKTCGSVVCDPPPGQPDTDGSVKFYGGECILESCPMAVRKQIVRLHNLAIGFGGEPSRDQDTA